MEGKWNMEISEESISGIKMGNSWGVVYKDTTANQAYLMDSLPCRTHPLQSHVEVLTSPSPSLGRYVCVLPEK
jgi:hypothetical protein